VLQGRFDDQSELLRAELSSNAVSKARLMPHYLWPVANGHWFQERFENIIQNLHCDIAVLQSDKANSQATLQKAEARLLETTRTATLLQARLATELKLSEGSQEQRDSARDHELSNLRQKIQEVEENNARLMHSASTINARHKAGDLVSPSVAVITCLFYIELKTEEEKAFVNSVIQMLKDIHEQELVAKSNELRRVSSLH
jgi:hypothetical protein